jgi:hypothetical protein
VKGFWNNLRPLEKRLMFGVGVLVLVVANFWIVVPHFSDLGQTQKKISDKRDTLQKFQKEIQQKPQLEGWVRALEGEGLAVPPEEQTTHFASTIQSQALQSGVAIPSSGKQTIKTQQFFLEVSQNITVLAKEQPLVDFLFNLGGGNSLVRVRDIRLHPDPPRQQLQGDIRLVASYQKKIPVRTSAPAKTGTAKAPPTTTTPSQAPVQTGPSAQPPPQKSPEKATTAPATKPAIPPAASGSTGTAVPKTPQGSPPKPMLNLPGRGLSTNRAPVLNKQKP